MSISKCIWRNRRFKGYALATLYYSTNGETWNLHGLWLTDENECGKWGNAIDCSEGAVDGLLLNALLDGTIPNEISMMSNLGD